MEDEDAEYDAYRFYQILEEKSTSTSESSLNSEALIEEIKLTPDLAQIMKRLWESKGVQNAFSLRGKGFFISDCTKYFLTHVGI